MKRWKVFINGTNFRMPFTLAEASRKGSRKMDVEAKVRRMGFCTTVFVTARSPREAEFRAVKVISSDKGLRASVRNEVNDPPRLFADEIAEIESFRGCRLPRTGLVFYAERGRKRVK